MDTATIDRIIDKHQGEASSLIQVLLEIQSELNWLPKEVLGEVGEKRAACPACGTHRVVDVATSAGRDGRLDLSRTPADLGLPPYDVIVARRGLVDSRAWLFDGDAESVLGDLADRPEED